MNKGRLIILSAPSGAGKTAVIKNLMSRHPEMIHSISCTTRPKRPGSVDDNYYTLISREVFQAGIKNNQFAEWAEVHGNLYGTPREPIDSWLREGRDVLLDLDVVGCLKLQGLYRESSVSIFIMPPSIEELRKRLASRKTDSKEAQGLRLKNAIEEMKYQDKYDHVIVNDVLERACLEIEGILKL